MFYIIIIQHRINNKHFFLSQFSLQPLLKIYLYMVILTLSSTLNLGSLSFDSISLGKEKSWYQQVSYQQNDYKYYYTYQLTHLNNQDRITSISGHFIIDLIFHNFYKTLQ